MKSSLPLFTLHGEPYSDEQLRLERAAMVEKGVGSNAAVQELQDSVGRLANHASSFATPYGPVHPDGSQCLHVVGDFLKFEGHVIGVTGGYPSYKGSTLMANYLKVR